MWVFLSVHIRSLLTWTVLALVTSIFRVNADAIITAKHSLVSKIQIKTQISVFQLMGYINKNHIHTYKINRKENPKSHKNEQKS